MKTSAIAGIAVAAFLFVCTIASCRTIAFDEVGVRSTMGVLYTKPLRSGVHFVYPFDTLKVLDTKVRPFEVTCNTASKDIQIVKTTVKLQHSLNPEYAPQAYSNFGDLDAMDISIISPAVVEALKEVTANFTAEELVTQREVVKKHVEEAIERFVGQTFDKKDMQLAIVIGNIAITEFDFSDEFDASIEAKVKAQQDALRAENEKTKLITEAQAKAEQARLLADTDAYTIEQKSKSQAEAIKREAEALSNNPMLLQLRAIEKWQGNVPTYTGTGAVPFIELGK